MPQSELEQAFEHYWEMFAPDDISLHCQYKFALPRKFAFDYAHLDTRVAIEIDGGQWAAGGGRHNQDSDREKLNLAAVKGWRVLRFSGTMLKGNPRQCIETVLLAIQGET